MFGEKRLHKTENSLSQNYSFLKRFEITPLFLNRNELK